ncbi:zincin-like metallopeptidase domain-containing protein [bacterium]|nr:zincin-like metallopeptidase domain-containing protein [bacterium]
MATQIELRQQITNSIVESLKSGRVPFWRKPWCDDLNAGVHTSLSTGNPYRGINQLLLLLSAETQGFRSRWWGSYNQIRNAGASVRKGQKGTTVTLYKPVKRTRVDQAGKEVDDKFCIMRSYTVFNVEQTNGMPQFEIGTGPTEMVDHEKFSIVDALIAAAGVKVLHGGNRASYSIKEDLIRMPNRNQFGTASCHAETLLHEGVHATEHPKRLNWDQDQPYAFNELIAEIGSCFLMSNLGLPLHQGWDNHVAYLGSWLKAMDSDSKWIFKAAAQASRACDFLMSVYQATAIKNESSVVAVA